MIIDFHAHTFPDAISEKVLAKLSRACRAAYFTDGSVSGLLASMREAGIAYTVNLPVMTTVDQVEKVNGKLARDRERLREQGIITFGGMHPDYGDYRAQLRRLKQDGIPGIKLHPAYQGIDIDDIRMMRIIDYASELGLIVVTHAGIDIGIYDRNYASTAQILRVIREVRPEKFVLAHMGGWACWKEVERDLAGAPVWLDTAFSVGPVTPAEGQAEPPYLSFNLSDEDFVRIARKHGTDKILFATDSPWEDQKDYVGRISRMPLSAEEKEQIFSGNARRLLFGDEKNAVGEGMADMVKSREIPARRPFHTNIFLIGFMGSGKTTISQRLAAMFDMEAVEMDQMIARREGMSISDIFAAYGEEYFRSLETGLLAELTSRSNAVVSCGGGTPMRDNNVAEMKKNGSVVLLTARPETIYERVKDSHDRPLLENNKNIPFISELMEKRREKYEAAADIIVETDGKSELEICEEIVRRLPDSDKAGR